MNECRAAVDSEEARADIAAVTHADMPKRLE